MFKMFKNSCLKMNETLKQLYLLITFLYDLGMEYKMKVGKVLHFLEETS